MSLAAQPGNLIFNHEMPLPLLSGIDMTVRKSFMDPSSGFPLKPLLLAEIF